MDGAALGNTPAGAGATTSTLGAGALGDVADFERRAAAEGQRGVRESQGHPRTPSLLLLDVQVRALDDAASMQTLLQLARAASIPILLMGSGDDVMSQTETIGAVACMRKPLQLGRLLQLVEAHRR